MYYYDGFDHVKLYRLQEIITKNTKFEWTKNVKNTISRYNEYTDRGFIIKKPTNTIDELNDMRLLIPEGFTNSKVIRVVASGKIKRRQ